MCKIRGLSSIFCRNMLQIILDTGVSMVMRFGIKSETPTIYSDWICSESKILVLLIDGPETL